MSVEVVWSQEPTAVDNVDSNIVVICRDENTNTVESAGTYSVGITSVTCKAQDLSSNEGMCTFTVEVRGKFKIFGLLNYQLYMLHVVSQDRHI